MQKPNRTLLSLNRKEIYLEYFALMKIYNQKNDGKMRIGFVYDTSRFIKAISYIFDIINLTKKCITHLYSFLYIRINKKQIDKMQQKITY